MTGPAQAETGTQPVHARLRLVVWAGVAAIGGFLFGFDTGVISGALLFVEDDFNLNSFEQGTVVSSLLLGAIVGALVGGRLADQYGRRATLLIVAGVFTGGLVLASLSLDFWVLTSARFILGLAVGAGSVTVPLYLSEIAPTAIRGRLVALNQLLITVGIVVSYTVDFIFAGSENWRAMFAVGIVPSIVMLLGLYAVPESPVWLERNERHEDARAVLARLHPPSDVDETLHGYERSRRQEPPQLGLRDLFQSAIRPALIIGIALAAIQQFGGINTIIYYAPSIMERTGLTASNSIIYSIIIGSLNLAMTVVSIPLVDRLGRRPLLLISLSGMLVSLFLLGLAFVTAYGGDGSQVALACILIYIASFAIGLGPIFWLLIAEIFPPQARAAGASFSTMVNWASNFLVGQLFLPVVDLIGQGQTFWLFALVCAASLVFVARQVPETKNRTFADIDAQLRSRALQSPEPGYSAKV